MKGHLVVLEDPPRLVRDVVVCDSQDHEKRLATKRLAWVTGPVEYCDGCAARMLRVAEVLGTYVHVEPVVQPEDLTRVPSRAIDLSGVKV